MWHTMSHTHTTRHTPHTHTLSLSLSLTLALFLHSRPLSLGVAVHGAHVFAKRLTLMSCPSDVHHGVRPPWVLLVHTRGIWDFFYLSVVASLQWRVDGVASRALTSPPSISLTHGTACTTAVGRASAVGQTDRGDSPECNRSPSHVRLQLNLPCLLSCRTRRSA
jgi:hypothetical protein